MRTEVPYLVSDRLPGPSWRSCGLRLVKVCRRWAGPEPCGGSKVKGRLTEKITEASRASRACSDAGPGSVDLLDSTGLCVDVDSTGLCVDVDSAGLCVDVDSAGLCVDVDSTGLCVDVDSTGLCVDVDSTGLCVDVDSTGLCVDVDSAGLGSSSPSPVNPSSLLVCPVELLHSGISGCGPRTSSPSLDNSQGALL
ncbi:hypothetical protein EYF80_060802 [Liparis tanakae]|uniref:Uncharacterized protein n=1 Tax=Liparis tanakae TaxID=230148 RepID=A0A4Z2EK91_9TELE|nr:hypothetical protein EYF80_060802 [Liparis tanakae]